MPACQAGDVHISRIRAEMQLAAVLAALVAHAREHWIHRCELCDDLRASQREHSSHRLCGFRSK